MLYTLMVIIGPLLLLGVIIWGFFYTRNRPHRLDKARDEGTRELREELNREDTTHQPRR